MYTSKHTFVYYRLMYICELAHLNNIQKAFGDRQSVRIVDNRVKKII